MPRRSKGPWKRKQDSSYYTTVNGEQVKLTEPGESYEVAKNRYYEVHANSDRPVHQVPSTVAEVLDEFLEWTQHNLEATTYRWYLNYLRKFHKQVGSRLLVASLKPLHVERWIQADYKGASNNNKRGAIKAVKRAFNWAIDMGITTSNPIARLKKPSYEPCEEYCNRSREKTDRSQD